MSNTKSALARLVNRIKLRANLAGHEKADYFYVSAIDCGKYALMLGPFKTHEGALQKVNACRNKAYDIDPRSHWWQWGTCKKSNETPQRGRMNRFFNLD